MPAPWVLVIGETPSLSSSLVEFLEACLGSQGVGVVSVGSLGEAEQLCSSRKAAPPPVLISACNQAWCRTPYLWPQSSLKDCHLVMVGGRDGMPRGNPKFHQVHLPPRVLELEELLNSLLWGPT